MIDAYAHVGLPRFMSLDAYRQVMDWLGIRKALLASFDSCPDLAMIHRAFSGPDGTAFRGLGLPLGDGRDTIRRCVEAQLDAGFAGLRVTAADVAAQPWLLDQLGERGGLVLVVGDLGPVAEPLLGYLERHSDGLVLGGHFSAPGEPLVLGEAPLRPLVEHPRFAVVCSRQGHFPADLVEPWMRALIERIGWRRLLWGSEVPVIFWRDEPVKATPHWIERFAPSAAERADFLAGNAERLIFSRPAPALASLDLPFDPLQRLSARPAPMWPFGVAVPTDIAGRLVAGWLAWGGEDRGPLGTYLAEVLDGALPDLPG